MGTAGTPDEAGAIRCISRQYRVEPLLKLTDLLRAPPIGRVEQTGRNIAFREMLQLHGLAAQPDIDRHDDLLDRAEAVRLMRTWVPRQVDQFVAGQETPRSPVNYLFIGRGRSLWPPTRVVEQYFDRRTVDYIEPDDIAAAVAA